MKMVKSLLLGSAAGVVAVVGAQAADLPVKAKPVEYVKICTLYGEGFYYIPGTDICLKLGGYIRADYGYRVTGARTPEYFGVEGRHTRASNEWSTRHRFNLNIDTRTQTPYGTLRTFGSAHFQNEDAANAAAFDNTLTVARAFIQWAGFTFGRTQSFTDSISIGDGGVGSLHQTQNQSDTGASGTNQIAYTWELGNGMSLSIGADERRTKRLVNLANTSIPVGTEPGDSRGGNLHMNPWVAFKINQAWGRFSLAAIANRNNATYYSQTANPVTGATGCPPGAQPGTTQCFYPDDAWGFAILAGGEIKTPFLGPRDTLFWFVNYGQGASAYAAGSNLASPGLFGSGNQVGFGALTDGVFVTGSQIELTTAWTAAGGYQHWWTNNFMTAVYGTYTEVSYNDTVKNSRWFCGGGGAAAPSYTIPAGRACDPDWRYWTVGVVQNWYPTPGFRLAVDVLWVNVDTAFAGPVTLTSSAINPRPTGAYDAKDLGTLSVVFRAQRTFPAAAD